jgi:hypothetical protein
MWHYVYGMKEAAWVKQPTTTTGHYTICCKKSQSFAPEDGQTFARNMFSWSWRSINCYCCISFVFYSTLPTLMMLGQTQIKFNFVMSVHMEQLGSHWTDFHEIWYLNIFRKSVGKIQVSLKSERNDGYFTWRPIYVFDHISLSSS